jgi:hypothetical protein
MITSHVFFFITKKPDVRERVDEILANKHPEVHDEWVMSLHQILPENDNWMMKLALEPSILDMLEHILVCRPRNSNELFCSVLIEK